MKICVLTLSSKGDGMCLSGYNIDNGKWVRLVENEEGDALSRALMKKIKILDVIEFDIVKYAPLRWNKENIIAKNIKVVDKKSLYEICTEYGIDNDEVLFDDGKYYVKEDNLKELNKTLSMIFIKKGIIKTKLNTTEECMQYLEFDYKKHTYHLKITDLTYPYTSRDDLTGMELNDIIVVCSVQGKLKPNSHCYKFACQIFKVGDRKDIMKNLKYRGNKNE